MPYTVWSCFDAFRKAYVDLDPDVTATARRSRDYLFTQLAGLSKTDTKFPTLAGDFLPYGSFARRTKIRPLDDMDLLVPLSAWGTSIYSSSYGDYCFLEITNTTSPLAKFVTDGRVNSKVILNQMKSSLSAVSSYRKAELHRRQQAVTLMLPSYGWNYDVVPAVAVSDGAGGRAYFLIPDGTGDWIKTDPRRDQTNITSINSQHSNMFLPTVRLLKYWKELRTQLDSYYFETLAFKVFNHAPKIQSLHQAVRYFFDNCPLYLMTSCPDPKGLGPNLDKGLDSSTKTAVQVRMRAAAVLAGQAIYQESLGNQKEAINAWRDVFGSNFPQYGS